MTKVDDRLPFREIGPPPEEKRARRVVPCLKSMERPPSFLGRPPKPPARVRNFSPVRGIVDMPTIIISNGGEHSAQSIQPDLSTELESGRILNRVSFVNSAKTRRASNRTGELIRKSLGIPKRQTPQTGKKAFDNSSYSSSFVSTENLLLSTETHSAVPFVVKRPKSAEARSSRTDRKNGGFFRNRTVSFPESRVILDHSASTFFRNRTVSFPESRIILDHSTSSTDESSQEEKIAFEESDSPPTFLDGSNIIFDEDGSAFEVCLSDDHCEIQEIQIEELDMGSRESPTTSDQCSPHPSISGSISSAHSTASSKQSNNHTSSTMSSDRSTSLVWKVSVAIDPLPEPLRFGDNSVASPQIPDKIEITNPLPFLIKEEPTPIVWIQLTPLHSFASEGVQSYGQHPISPLGNGSQGSSFWQYSEDTSLMGTKISNPDPVAVDEIHVDAGHESNREAQDTTSQVSAGNHSVQQLIEKFDASTRTEMPIQNSQSRSKSPRSDLAADPTINTLTEEQQSRASRTSDVDVSRSSVDKLPAVSPGSPLSVLALNDGLGGFGNNLLDLVSRSSRSTHKSCQTDNSSISSNLSSKKVCQPIQVAVSQLSWDSTLTLTKHDQDCPLTGADSHNTDDTTADDILNDLSQTVLKSEEAPLFDERSVAGLHASSSKKEMHQDSEFGTITRSAKEQVLKNDDQVIEYLRNEESGIQGEISTSHAAGASRDERSRPSKDEQQQEEQSHAVELSITSKSTISRSIRETQLGSALKVKISRDSEENQGEAPRNVPVPLKSSQGLHLTMLTDGRKKHFSSVDIENLARKLMEELSKLSSDSSEVMVIVRQSLPEHALDTESGMQSKAWDISQGDARPVPLGRSQSAFSLRQSKQKSVQGFKMDTAPDTTPYRVENSTKRAPEGQILGGIVTLDQSNLEGSARCVATEIVAALDEIPDMSCDKSHCSRNPATRSNLRWGFMDQILNLCSPCPTQATTDDPGAKEETLCISPTPPSPLDTLAAIGNFNLSSQDQDCISTTETSLLRWGFMEEFFEACTSCSVGNSQTDISKSSSHVWNDVQYLEYGDCRIQLLSPNSPLSVVKEEEDDLTSGRHQNGSDVVEKKRQESPAEADLMNQIRSLSQDSDDSIVASTNWRADSKNGSPLIYHRKVDAEELPSTIHNEYIMPTIKPPSVYRQKHG